MQQLLSDAIDEYLLSRKSQGYSPATVRNDELCLRRFMTVTGNIFLRNVTERHVTNYFSEAQRTRPRSLNVDNAILKSFFEWGRKTRRMHRDSDPMFGRRRVKVIPNKKLRVPVTKFPLLLDKAESHHPRDRMFIALGLYLLSRGSEATTVRIGDIDLDSRTVRVEVHKTREVDLMPVSEELDWELRRWLTFYTQEVGPLDPNWYLVPAKTNALFEPDPTTGRLVLVAPPKLRPDKKISQPAKIIQRVLQDCGYAVRDASGTSLREGFHTLRRSGARALYEVYRAQGHDYAIDYVQAMLHHKSRVNTELYIGLEARVKSRDDLIRGKRMYPLPAENVVSLAAKGGQGGQDHHHSLAL